MLVKEAEKITGGLSGPSKMPGPGYSIPATACKVGAKLRKVPNSACAGCYALKNRYMFPNTQNAMHRRMDSIQDDAWVDAMAFLINKQAASAGVFRWHDSGDIQGMYHMDKISKVCELTPTIRHWIPTRESKLVKQYMELKPLPPNLTVRISAAMIDQDVSNEIPGTTYSTIHSKPGTFAGAHECPAAKQGNKCGSCRACWDPSVKHVSYPKH